MFPLPGLLDAPAPQRRLSRSLRDRLRRRLHFAGRVTESAQALNALHANDPLSVWRVPSRRLASVTEGGDRHTQILRGLREDHKRFAQSTADAPEESCRAAYKALLAKHLVGYDGSLADLGQYGDAPVSKPALGTRAVDLAALQPAG